MFYNYSFARITGKYVYLRGGNYKCYWVLYVLIR